MTGKRELQIKHAAVVKATGATTLLLSVALQIISITPSYAQAADSMLPPEVIPVDSGNTPSYQPQINGANSNANVPGLVNGQSGANPMMMGGNAQQMRQQMMNSLMGQGVYPQFHGQTSGSPMNNAAAQSFSGGAPGLQAPGAAPGVNGSNPGLGQSGWNTPGQQNNGQAVPAQSQTLSGGVQNQVQQNGNRRGSGYSHGFSALSGFGLSAFGMGLALRGNPSALYGNTGLMGVGMLNNGFRSGFSGF